MASPPVLAFDAEGRPVKSETWLDDQHLVLQVSAKEDISLYDHALSHATAPAATADSTARSQWQTRDAHARFAIRNSLPIDEREHFVQHKTAQALYTAVVARYSSPASVALGRLSLPYLFPDLASFHTVADLITHLRTSEARFRATMLDEFLAKNPPPLWLTLYHLVTRLADTLRVVRDHFLARCPTKLTIALLEKELLAAEASIVAVASASAVDLLGFEKVGAASASSGHRSGKGKGGKGGGGDGGGGSGGGSGAVGVVVGVVGLVAAVGVVAATAGAVAGAGAVVEAAVDVAAAGEEVVEAVVAAVVVVAALAVARAYSTLRRPRSSVSGTLGMGGVVALAARTSSALVTALFPDATELPRWANLMKQNIDIFALDFDAILSAMYVMSVSGEGAQYLSVPPDPGILPGEATALGARVSATPGAGEAATLGAGVSTSPVTESTEALHTFTLDSGASHYFFRDRTALEQLTRPVAVSLADPSGGPVLATSSTVLPCPAVPLGTLSGLYLPSFSTNLVAGSALQDRGVHQFTLAYERVTDCTCAHTGRHQATFTRQPGSDLYTLTTESPQVAASASASARVRGQGQERYFLIVVDDYSRYTTVFPLRTKREVPDVLIPWIRASRLQLSERFHSDFLVLRLHSDRGGEFSSDLLAAYCAEHGILRYDAQQLNLWPRVSFPGTSPTLRWTGEVGDASRFRVWGSWAFVRDTSADKLSSRAVPCVFLGFVPDASGWQFYHAASHRVLASQDVTFDESVPFYRLFPYRTAPLPPPPLFLAPGAAAVDPLPPQGAAPSGVSQEDPVEPVEVAVDSRPPRGVEPECAEPGGAESEGAEPGGAQPGGAGFVGAEPGRSEPAGAESGGAELGSATPEGALSSQQLREWYIHYYSLRRGAAGAGARASSPRRELPSPQRLREWYAQHCSLRSGAPSVADPATGAADPGVGAAAGTEDPGVGAAAGAADPGVGAAAGVADPGVGAAAGAADPGVGAAAGTAAPDVGAAAGAADPGVGATAGAADPGVEAADSTADPGVGAAAGAADPSVGGTRGAARAARDSGAVSATTGGTSRPRPYFVPLLQQVLVAVLRSSLPALADPESDSLRAASPTVTRLLSTTDTDPSFESAAASALVAELVDFVARCRLDYATIAPKGDPDAPNISTPRSYAEAIEGPYSSQWQSAMDTEMASWKSTGTYVDEVPPPGANIVSGMWIFRVKRPPGSLPVFKARYVARGFSQREGVDFF
ncbi:unnamed protein product [Closterium sp. NIES-64]|nr:unnamed protein product [Closterium sp. NIES-64]